jgi:glycosyltransferase involved in cell wall biosynthesis
MLVREHVAAGHEVQVIASTESFNSSGQLIYLEPSQYKGQDGANVIRLPYRKFLPHRLMSKLRFHPGVYKLLEDFKPEVIVFHGPCGGELLTVSRYIRNNPNVKLFVDSHEDFNNSARGFFSKTFLYKCFYIPIIHLARSYVEKFLYITYETKRFCSILYGLRDDELEFFPLGGVVLDDADYFNRRQATRNRLGITDNQVIFFQSGKFDEKKKVIESLHAFRKLGCTNARFLLTGNFSSSIKDEAISLIESDPRITFLGWSNSDQLLELLCAADVYVQPGSQSATLQMSIAARCAVIIDDVPSHRDIFCDNGFLVSDTEQLADAIHKCAKDSELLENMSEHSLKFANKKLNYTVLAARLVK